MIKTNTKETLTYKKKYKYNLTEIYSRGTRYEDPTLLKNVYETDKKDRIRDYLIENSIVSGSEEDEQVVRIGMDIFVKRENKFLWNNGSLFCIELSREDNLPDYNRIITITSMPPSNLPKCLESKLKEEGFKKINPKK
ncbi:hypothetical protein HYS72_00105 [Candidatus Pacearchaeota archaeon]|nr:hypothetical protein [Candidatus Pacearchaeota archaeon]MBI2056895.1 hypothetical protein [Candidatus Pacearchaeota archaeon]